ncbi:MAG: site-specific DNA-methyltransferase [Defluviitaleaceae bacterium]|nr:site-specific DNA-methyltransferase [Defluviitaleaceae bacterium]
MNPSNEKLNRFISLLEGMFELDKADLDFGIYRIMNIRKDEIAEFLSNSLPKKVQEALAPFAADTGVVTTRIAEIEKQADNLGIEITASPKLTEEYSRLKARLARGTDLFAMEADVYSALYNFFNRYYDEGDFISKRRYKEGVYAIPYEGEEVKLHWANSDQYYIKTAENFRDYTFVVDGKKVHFRLVDATTEKNNNIEANGNKRAFMLYAETDDAPGIKTIEEVDSALVIRFVYDIPVDKKKKYAEDNLATIMDILKNRFRDWWQRLLAPATSARSDKRTVLEKHMTAYVAKNTFDYFIHKDLHGFLTRELDFFIKSEVIHLEDIDTTDEKRVDTYLAKIRAIKRVGKIIIDFLAQIEDFQKKLWLKKKFVVATNWCITLDRVSEAFYPEIISNAAQIAEWVDMYAINEIEADLTSLGYTDPLTADVLRQNGNLVLDTKHFSADFKDRLVASVDDLDEQTGGLMIHSDNFQALRLLTEKYKSQVKCIYIDPPYNTDASEIIYKNNYKHSSFIALMENRLSIARQIMADDSIIAVSIDDAEMPYLQNLLTNQFAKNVGIAVVRSNPQSRKAKGKFSPSHEYCLFYSKREETVPRSIGTRQEKLKRYPLKDEVGNYAWMNFIRAGNDDLRTNRPFMYFPIAVSDDGSIRILKMRWDNEAEEYHLLEKPLDNETLVYPVKSEGGVLIEKRWQRGLDRVKEEILNGEYRVRRVNGEISIDFKTRMDDDALPITWWDKNEYASANYFAKEIKALFAKKTFDFGKAIMIVNDAICASGADESDAVILDFFAGSGTTGHAVINLNRADGEAGQRRYLLVEMGEYFNAVTLPRIKKAVYSADWRNGKPQNRNTGVSHIMKYLVLESYEDALLNIELSDDFHRLMTFLGEEYMLRYMFDSEAKDSMLMLEAFNTPFSYSFKISENNETRDRTVDLCETFNYLLGLTVVRQSAPVSFNATLDPKGEYENAVRLEQAKGGEFTFRQIEGRLPDGRAALIIWRNVTKDILCSNAALDAYFTENSPLNREFDVIFVNGDNNLENLRLDDETWKVQRIEPVFKEKMFEGAE